MSSEAAKGSSFTTTEAADYLGVSTATLKRWAQAGLLAAERTEGRHRRFRVEDVRALAVSRAGLTGPVGQGADLLARAGSSVKVHGWLLQSLREVGSWRALDGRLHDMVAELYRRRATGAMRGVQLEGALDRLRVALIRSLDSTIPGKGAPTALVASLPGDPHAVVPALIQLVAVECGWRTEWAGRPTVEDLREELHARPFQALVLCSSEGAGAELVQRHAAAHLALAAEGQVPTAVVSPAAWPGLAPSGAWFSAVAQLGAWLSGLAADLAAAAPAAPAPDGEGPRRWNPAWDLGEPVLDAQREATYVVVARLQAALARGTAGESARVMVRFIQENSALHFQAEEALLAASGHLRRAEHQADHREFTRLLAELGRALDDQAAAPALEAMGLRLADGLGRHLAAGDRQLEGPRPGVAQPA